MHWEKIIAAIIYLSRVGYIYKEGNYAFVRKDKNILKNTKFIWKHLIRIGHSYILIKLWQNNLKLEKILRPWKLTKWVFYLCGVNKKDDLSLWKDYNCNLFDNPFINTNKMEIYKAKSVIIIKTSNLIILNSDKTDRLLLLNILSGHLDFYKYQRVKFTVFIRGRQLRHADSFDTDRLLFKFLRLLGKGYPLIFEFENEDAQGLFVDCEDNEGRSILTREFISRQWIS